ncbi:hypothetical protein GPAL_1020 [Glaciecola pallidula DSM 14239 = ACAM 615]|uniref:Uncharacterized protein n=1 Tax=Brumicola pallidula DSM 14239 = ACAM 615 TaxID=1121922 RepID=K6Y540_9ALTE|nr:hypothetical protein GPAL_1020 [Glaciecola pallidula DSM 14239 = ACAM 615]
MQDRIPLETMARGFGNDAGTHVFIGHKIQLHWKPFQFNIRNDRK